METGNTQQQQKSDITQTPTQLQKQQSENLERIKATGEILMAIGTQYAMEFTPELAQLWMECLEDLTPTQIREGFKYFLKSDKRGFRPTPGMIRACAPDYWGGHFEGESYVNANGQRFDPGYTPPPRP